MRRSGAGAEGEDPTQREFATKPTLGGELAVRAAGWEIARAPVLGDQAYGDDSKLRARLDQQGLEYVLSVSAATTVFAAGTRFEIPSAKPGAGRPRSVPKADHEHIQVKTLAASLKAKRYKTVTYRDRDGEDVRSRLDFCDGDRDVEAGSARSRDAPLATAAFGSARPAFAVPRASRPSR